MKIEKLKVLGAKPFSAATKNAIAATFGIAAAFTLNACDDSTSANSEQGIDPIPNSINSSETISSSSQAEETPTSSSNSIPLSHEPVSSSLMEAISSALESSSSAADPTSSTVEPASSEVEPANSTVEPASSASVPASSSSQPTDQEIKNACQMSGTPYVNIGAEVYFCPDVSGETVLFSMVSTFERTDAEV